jgi:hypothetical protein
VAGRAAQGDRGGQLVQLRQQPVHLLGGVGGGELEADELADRLLRFGEHDRQIA